MKILTILLTLHFVLNTQIHPTYSANILALFPVPLKSHFMIFDHLFLELANRGHNVTVVTPFPKSDQPLNYHQINVEHCFKIPEERFNVDYLIREHQDTFKVLEKMIFLINNFDKILQCTPMRELATTKNNYDLVMTELFVSDALLAYAYKFQTPFILFSTHPLMPWSSGHVGNPDNPSYVPFRLSHHPMGPHLSFYDRLYNTFVYMAALYHYNYKWIPKTDEIIRKYFGNDIPSVGEIAKNTSLILTLNHFSLTYPRPLIPAVVEVGGLHIKETPQPLPEDIRKFLDDAKDGVIYMSMGSLMRSHTMPIHMRETFVEVFKQLPQRVLWKWEEDELPGKSENVMIKKWMPQRDILAHSNVKLFISHSGLFGLYEAIWEAVPIIGIPFYGDQKMNIKSIEVAGVGVQLLFQEITKNKILEKINSILGDKRYRENALKLSSIFKDRPVKPLESAVYWTEYVIRHKGARHLQSAAVTLSWYQYFLIDVVAVIGSSLLIVVGIIYLSCYFSIRAYRRGCKMKQS